MTLTSSRTLDGNVAILRRMECGLSLHGFYALEAMVGVETRYEIDSDSKTDLST